MFETGFTFVNINQTVDATDNLRQAVAAPTALAELAQARADLEQRQADLANARNTAVANAQSNAHAAAVANSHEPNAMGSLAVAGAALFIVWLIAS